MKDILRAAVFWSVAFPYTFAIYLILIGSVLPLKIFSSSKVSRVAHRIAGLWAAGFFKFIPGWNLVIQGRENIPASQRPAIFVANHQSMADIWAMYALGSDFCWLSKQEVFNLPMLGRAMKWADYIPVLRNSRDSTIEAMRQSRARLQAGRSMFFFPEGTRSENDVLRPFKVGAFKLSEELEVPIVPIAIDGAGRLMRKGSLIPRRSEVRMKICPALLKSQDETLESFAARTREIISAEVDQLKKLS
jgi:1-acyl-sn-glycerol-3-phosphate acyltransferase